jgi:alpha-galactosidase
MDGWCSWYDRTTKIDEKHIVDVIETFEENKELFAPRVIQIDDGYQVMDGEWVANEKFPSGVLDWVVMAGWDGKYCPS